MTSVHDIERWRRVLVYGLGLSGRAAARLLLERGVTVVGVDGRPREALDLDELTGIGGSAGLDVRAGAEPEALPDGIDAVVVSPGVPLERPLLADARERGVPVLAEVELAFPLLDGPVVAVTGSNGKSTTTALAGAMLAEAGWDARVCGNIGAPLSSQVGCSQIGSSQVGSSSAGTGARVAYAVELSSFQLSTIDAFRPRAAALLNVAADHLDRHGTLEGYAAAKRRIFENQAAEDVAVLNADDPIVRDTAVRARRRFFSRAAEVEDGCFLLSSGDGPRIVERDASTGTDLELFAAADVPLPGAHNLANAMAAALLARALGTEPEALRRALTAFRGLPHRMERVAEHAGVTWYDDSKGTNPAATLGCLEGFGDGTVHLILGGRNKGNDFAELAAAAGRKCRRVYLIGEAAGEIEEAFLRGEGRPGEQAPPISRCGTLERVVPEAAERARPGEAVLLSPACASFDQFRDFNQRGDAFRRLVRATVEGARGQEAGV